jgi:hypothetical protein
MLIHLGFLVFPVMQGCKQPPLVKSWQTQASNEARTIRSWFSRNCNVAVCTGPLSNIFVLDIDPKSGGALSLANLLSEHGLLPETLTVTTPSGGGHRYFRWPGNVYNSRSQLGAGLDIRGNAGYVLAPPSYIMDRETGEVREYEWACDPLTTPVADAPPWLLKLIRERPRPDDGAAPLPTLPQPKRALSEDDRDRRYGEVWLIGACREIATAPNGRQHETLMRCSGKIGKLVGGGYIGAGRALSELVAAGMQMANHQGGNPWTHQQVGKNVLDGITWGMSRPWEERKPR